MREPRNLQEAIDAGLMEMGIEPLFGGTDAVLPHDPDDDERPPATQQAPPSTKPATNHQPPATTFDDLVEVLRACPAEELPATVQYATAPEPDPSEIRNPQSAIRNSTRLGSPRARAWDDAWLDAVDAAETRIGRRICGARLLDGTPCEIGSDHPSGRCRFHGGFDLTGAPPGNRNAYIHGLYSRRLKTCGDHCPNWANCPMAQPDIENIPHQKRPICPYEQAEYNTALADALDLSCKANHMTPFRVHIAHNIATLQVMLGRAMLEIKNTAISAHTHAESDKYTFSHEQVRPQITAIARIGGELRKYVACFDKGAPAEIEWDQFQARRRTLREDQSGPEPEEYEYVPPDNSAAEAQRKKKLTQSARKAITRAVIAANEGRLEDAIAEWNRADNADPTFTDNWTTKLRKTINAKQKAAARKKPPT